MASRDKGPVKPPVLDLEASKKNENTDKSAADKKPEAQTSAAAKASSPTSAPTSASAAKPAEKKADAAQPSNSRPSASKTATETKDPDKTASEKGPTKPADKKSAEDNPKTVNTSSRSTGSAFLPITTGLLGAVAGAALAYGLAYYGYWPNASTPVDASGDIAALSETTSRQQQEIEALSAQLSEMSGSASSSAGETTSAIEELRADVAALSENDNGEPVDLSGIEERLSSVENRVEAVAAGASSDDATALSQNIAALRTEISEFGTRLNAAEATASDAEETANIAREAASAAEEAAGAAQSNASDIGQQFATLSETRTQEAENRANAVQIPLALSGLESAILTGQPFANELAALEAALPDLSVPDQISSAASTGLPDPQDIAVAFQRAIPDILAARPEDPDAPWQERLMDRAKALIALRPTETGEAETPDALVAEIEAALNANDFSAAAAALAALPEPMRDAAGSVAADINRLVAAEEFAASARAAALKPENEGDAS